MRTTLDIADDVRSHIVVGVGSDTQLTNFEPIEVHAFQARGLFVCEVVVHNQIAAARARFRRFLKKPFQLRRILMQNNRVEAVLSLPGGVFQPYSGVKTSVLVFAKGGRTRRVRSAGRRGRAASHSASRAGSWRRARPPREPPSWKPSAA